MRDIIIISLFGIAASLFLLSDAFAEHKHTVNNYYSTTNESKISIDSVNQAIAIASGQHHYRSTNSLQWSIGAGYMDKSAVSFGLGKQVGKIFFTTDYSSDGKTSAIGFGASGSF